MARKAKDENVEVNPANRLESAVFKELLKKIQKEHGESILLKASDERAANTFKYETGILPLDIALGGGYASGRQHIVAGMFSSMKTTLILKIIARAQRYCSNCHLPKEQHLAESNNTCKEFIDVTVAYIEPEGTFDREWAKTLGVNVDNVYYSQPSSGEACIDIFDALLRSGNFDIAVLDSLATLVPMKVVEKSAGDGIVGTQALLVNRLIDKTTSALNDCANIFGKKPTVFYTNQYRQKITMFGDPNTLRGGPSPGYAATTITKLTAASKPEFDENGQPLFMPIDFKIEKNKMSAPKMEGGFKLTLADTETKRKGEIYDEDKVLELAENSGLYKKEGLYYYLEGIQIGTSKSQLERKLLMEPEFSQQVRKLILDKYIKNS